MTSFSTKLLKRTVISGVCVLAAVALFAGIAVMAMPARAAEGDSSYTFPQQSIRNTSVQTLECAVINNGPTEDTGKLIIRITGDTNAFKLSADSIENIHGVGNHVNYTVSTKPGLSAGTYNATITVSPETPSQTVNISGASLKVSYTVYDDRDLYMFSIPDFPTVSEGYAQPSAKGITLENRGDSPTGEISVSLEGLNPNAFRLLFNKIPSIAPGKTITTAPIVQPITDLLSGEYQATVRVTGQHESDYYFARITVLREINVIYGIHINRSETWNLSNNIPFRSYSFYQPTSSSQNMTISHTISNIGSRPTGALNVVLSGSGAEYFSAPSTINSIGVNGSATLTIRNSTQSIPVNGYTLTIQISNSVISDANENVIIGSKLYLTDTFGISITIRASLTGSSTQIIFPDQYFGYKDPPQFSFTITNNAIVPTGELVFSLRNLDSVLLDSEIPDLYGAYYKFGSIPAGGKVTVSFKLKTGLRVGLNSVSFGVYPRVSVISSSFFTTFTMSGTVNILWSSGVSVESFDISLEPGTQHVFPTLEEGYKAVTPLTVKVNNEGYNPTGALNISLSGTGTGSFTLLPSSMSIGSIGVDGFGTFTVAPIDELEEGTHTATISVGNTDVLYKNLDVVFTVTAKLTGEKSITLNPTVIMEFYPTSIFRSASPPDAKTATVTNDGNHPTGVLTVVLTGTHAASFKLSVPQLASIASKGGTAEFTVRPIPNLEKGIHSATVEVGGDGIETKSFNVRFVVFACCSCGLTHADNSGITAFLHTVFGNDSGNITRGLAILCMIALVLLLLAWFYKTHKVPAAKAFNQSNKSLDQELTAAVSQWAQHTKQTMSWNPQTQWTQPPADSPFAQTPTRSRRIFSARQVPPGGAVPFAESSQQTPPAHARQIPPARSAQQSPPSGRWPSAEPSAPNQQ